MTRYAGGKYRLGKKISESILEHERKYDEAHGITEKRTYFEPFVGMCGVMRHIPNDRKRVGCDLNVDVPAMWKGLQSGWEPPTEVSEEFYNRLRDDVKPGDPDRGIVASGCSWGGYHFSKYCPEVYPGSRRNVLKFFKPVKDVEFLDGRSYDEFVGSKELKNCTVYLDPPYVASKGCTGKKSLFLKNFDHEKFWRDVEEIRKDNLVFISEAVAPPDYKVIWEKETLSRMAGKGVEKRKLRYERLFVHESQSIDSTSNDMGNK